MTWWSGRWEKLIQRRCARATGYLRRYLVASDPEALTTCIHLLTSVFDVTTPDRVPLAALYLADLSTALRLRWARDGHVDDLDAALLYARESLIWSNTDPQTQSGALLTLGTALFVDAQSRGTRTSLEEAIRLCRRGAALTSSGPVRAHLLSILAAGLLLRFEITFDLADVEEAVDAGEESLTTASQDHHDQATFRHNLAMARSQMFAVHRREEDLDSAIDLYRGILRDWPDFRDRSLVLSNLGDALRLRFERGGDNADASQALAYARQAVERIGPAHPHASMLHSNLAAVHMALLRRVNDVEHLEQAVQHAATAVTASSMDSPLFARWQSNYAAILHLRYLHRSTRADLDQAIVIWESLLQTDQPFIMDAVMQTNLANALVNRYQDQDQDTSADLDRAIDLARHAVASSDQRHPQRSKLLFDLVEALALSNSESARREIVIRCLEGMRSDSGAPVLRLLLAVRAAAALTEDGAAAEALAIYETAIDDLLPTAAWHGFAPSTRQRYLSQFPGLSSAAAAAAITADRPGRALELLEAGRGMQWSQSLRLSQLRDALQQQAPELAARLDAVARELRSGIFGAWSGDVPDLAERTRETSWTRLLSGRT